VTGGPDLSELAARGVAAAIDAGADDAEIYLRAGEVTRMTLQNGDLGANTGWTCEAACRVWVAERLSILTTGDCDPTTFLALASRAVTEARRRGVPSVAQLATTSPRSSEIPPTAPPSPGSARRCLTELASAVSGHYPAGSLSAAYFAADQHRMLVNSRGLRAVDRQTQHRIWCWLEGPAGHTTLAAASRSGTWLDPAALAAELTAQAGWLDSPGGSVPDDHCAVLLPPRAAADLARVIAQMLTAERLGSDLKPLLDRVGGRIATAAVTLVDDTTLPGRLRTRPFDDEGTPAARTVLIDGGRLAGFLHTRATAENLGAEPNGKAARPEVWHHPKAAPTNVYLAPGAAGPAELASQLGRGLIVTGLSRPGQLHAATGRFTTLVHGWWVERDRPRRPVSGVPLSAGVFELLRNIRACGDDLAFSPLADGAGAPTVLVSKMRVG